MWLDRVKRHYGERLDVTWKSFSLEQVNSREGPDWKVWDEPNAERSRTLLSMRAGKAAIRQGGEPFERFHLALLVARHSGNGRIPLNQEGPLMALASEAGLDIARFEKDLHDGGLLDEIARDHTEAVERLGVFGTPTFVFENGSSAYLKSFVPPDEDSVPFFEHFVGLCQRTYVGEVKRPQPPWPAGALR